ncbi:hypothetical protein BGW80DRAFT_1248989 [Lactifluus volemus]|nr:hypothetical protein BGW80DRAFT_1248989 [Lactifluus volemus]
MQIAAEASFLTFFCVMITFILITRNVLRYRRELPNGKWKLLEAPADIFMLSLFTFDFLQAIGGILNVRWVHDDIVKTGSYCSAQGIIKQTSSLGTALITLMLTVYTFIAALWHKQFLTRGAAFGLVGLTWLFGALWVGIGNGIHKNYEAPTPYWCWISSKYDGERLAGEYVWLWISLFASFTMYIPLYLWAEGRFSVDKEKWYKFRSYSDDMVEYPVRRAALGMLFYPIAHSIVILPVSIARWAQYRDKDIPSVAFLFGTVDVILFFIIRPKLLLFTPPEDHVELIASS